MAKPQAKGLCSNCGGRHASLERSNECRSGADRKSFITITDFQWSSLVAAIKSLPLGKVFGK